MQDYESVCPAVTICSTLVNIHTQTAVDQLTWKWSEKNSRRNSVIFVNKNENENGEKRENNEFVNEN